MYSLVIRLDSERGQVALFQDSVLLAHCYSNNYYESSANKMYPQSSIEHCLEVAEIESNQVKEVIVVNKPFQQFDRTLIHSLSRWPFGVLDYKEGLVNFWKLLDALRSLKKQFSISKFYYCQPEDALVKSLDDQKQLGILHLTSNFEDSAYDVRVYDFRSSKFKILASVKKSHLKYDNLKNSLKNSFKGIGPPLQEVITSKWIHESTISPQNSSLEIAETKLLIGAKRCVDLSMGRETEIDLPKAKDNLDEVIHYLNKIEVGYTLVNGQQEAFEKYPNSKIGYWQFENIEMRGVNHRQFIVKKNTNSIKEEFRDENFKVLRCPQDAYRAFLKSSLDGLLFCEKIFIQKSDGAERDRNHV